MDVPKQWLDRAVELDRAEGNVMWAWGDHLLDLMPMRAQGRPNNEHQDDTTPVMELFDDLSAELEALGVTKAAGTLESYRSTAGAWETHTREGVSYSVAKALRTQEDRYDLVFTRDWTKSQAEEFATIRRNFDPKVTTSEYDDFLEARGLDPKLDARKYFTVNRELSVAFLKLAVEAGKLEKALADAGAPKGYEDETRDAAQEALAELEKLRATAQRRHHAIEVVEA